MFICAIFRNKTNLGTIYWCILFISIKYVSIEIARKNCPFKDIKDLECVGYIPECDDEKLTSILSQKRGIKRIQKASKARGTYVSVKLGMVVHKTCRA